MQLVRLDQQFVAPASDRDGLIRLPVLGRLYTAEEGLFPEYAGGMYQLDSGAPLIVGCGLGDSNRIPRVYNPPELVLVDVNWY